MEKKQNREGSGVIAATDAATDSDGDGLKDWEEALWRTDPANPDSDGDGTPDGAEVAAGRDPLKPGPNDRLAAVPGGLNDTAQTPGGDNFTYNLTKNLIESGVLNGIDGNGQVTSTDFLKNFSLPKNFDPDTLLRPAHAVSANDLQINPNDDPETVRAYFDAVSAAYRTYIVPHQARSDLVILNEVLDSKDYRKLAELDPLMTALDQAAAEIKRIPVPSEYQSFAVRELNYLLETKRAVEVFRHTQSDPMATMLVVQKRLQLLNEIAQFHFETGRLLQAKGIMSVKS